jgi:hypothetical protein
LPHQRRTHRTAESAPDLLDRLDLEVIARQVATIEFLERMRRRGDGLPAGPFSSLRAGKGFHFSRA